jgi:hypothetical protein
VAGKLKLTNTEIAALIEARHPEPRSLLGSDADGFRCIDHDNAEQSVLALLRRGPATPAAVFLRPVA